MKLMPSFIWKGHRFRVIWSTIHYRPIHETFHEFLVHVVKLTFGEHWWKSQLGTSAERRHAVVQWCFEWAELKRTREHRLEPDGVTHTSKASGPTWALLQLGYDLFCLQAKDRLPDFLVERLRSRKSFQSARYEIAIAAIMVRSGFEIEYLDDQDIKEKHCEFIATHVKSGLKIGVEAKSRRRSGVIHEAGEFAHTQDARGIEKLLRNARKKKPEGLPLLIFIDTNLPPQDGVPNEEKALLRDLRGMIDRIGGSKAESPDPFAALFVTNYAHHYGWPDGNSYRGEWVMALPRYTQHPVPPAALKRIYETAGRYDVIPDDI